MTSTFQPRQRRGGVAAWLTHWTLKCTLGSKIGGSGGSRPGWSLRCYVAFLKQETLLYIALIHPCTRINGYWRHTAGGNPVMNWHFIQGGVAILVVASRFQHKEVTREFEYHSKTPKKCLPISIVVSYHPVQ